MTASEYIKESRFTIVIMGTWEQLNRREPKPKYHIKATDPYETIIYNIYCDSLQVIKSYLKVSPYNLHRIQ